MTPELAICLAEYNRRMNEKVYRVAAGLSDEARREDRGAFFRSVHGTLNHLLWGDLVWLARFEGTAEPGGVPATEIATDFEELRRVRAEQDARIERFAASLTSERLSAPFSWTNARGIHRTEPLFLIVAHLFFHQTHHRGQLTTLFTQLGQDVGATDLPVVLREP